MSLYEKISQKYNKALVTGGAGFIGSHLVDQLLESGLEVISLDDYSAGKSENLNQCKDHPKFTAVKADVSRINEISNYFKDVDIVFHQACSKNTICMKDPARDLEVNATGTLNVLLCSKENGVKRVIHASTGSVYGEPQIFPTDENHPLSPVSYYGVSKLAGERYANVFNRLHGLDTGILRYHHVFGPRQDNSDVGGVVSIFARRALDDQSLIIYGTGEQVRSFTFVKDVVNSNLHLACIEKPLYGDVFNCASGIKVTINELAKDVKKYLGKDHLEIEHKDWKPGDIKRFDVNNSKLKSTGFEFQHKYEEGLAKTLDDAKSFYLK